MRLKDKVAVITGAGSGIGRATAERFASEGARLVVNDLRQEYLDELVPALDGEDHVALAGDVALEETAERLVATARERFGRLDVLVNNVGELFFKDITETTVEEWDRLLAVNLRSQFLLCKHAIGVMQEQGSGSIVNLASISAFIGQEMGVQSSFAYNVTKAGARQLATSLATRYAADGIRVNAVVPGPTRTKQVRHFVPDMSVEQEDAIWTGAGEEGTPMRRTGRPEEIANVILFLASDEASYVTGAAYPVDGGYLAR
jgi:meso-butanediol dehydrogenase/(S,S)-butanediol dehydrogenase/diacetyl reductase